MVVTRETFAEALVDMGKEQYLALDTETTGLKPYHGDLPFSIILASGDKSWYFNFNQYPDLDEKFLLTDAHLKKLGIFLSMPSHKFFLHNAKFDMHILRQAGIELKGFVHDTMIVARLLDNERMSLSLSSCLKDIGVEKDDRVEQFIAENELTCKIRSPYREKSETLKLYNFVDFDVIVPYGEQDALGTWALGVWQLTKLNEWHEQTMPSHASIMQAYEIECKLLHVIFEMEAFGVKIDKDFCINAADYEQSRAETAEAKFKEMTGEDFKNSGKVFSEIFKDKETMVLTEKGNNSFDSDTLAGFSSEEAKLILEVRDAYSRQNFYLGFLDAADQSDIVHASFNQAGTKTGRFSSSNPNLQNLTKEDGEDLVQEFVVRRAFVPRESFFFAMFDYDQMEYRMMLDYAGAHGLIKKVEEGLDVHQATANAAGISRHEAKTTNFTVLYGGGTELLAKRLKKSVTDASRIKAKIFEAAPEIKQYMNAIIRTAEQRTYIVNWAGFRVHYPDPKFCYKAPNAHIQGGCAYAMKKALIDIHQFLKPYESRLVLTIHDEAVIECHKDEAFILPEIKLIMEKAFPHKTLKLTCGIDHSFKSLADKVSGCPSA